MTQYDQQISSAIQGLDTWFESMRCPGGYGGPVVHWWRHCFQYTGPGRDWRYEGIMAGYLTLWHKNSDERWLLKAKRAGNELVEGQKSDGSFIASSFELNPASGGTPHEFACALALFELAGALRAIEDPCAEVYLTAACRQIEHHALDRLWDARSRYFRDHVQLLTFVPNKACTLIEALLAMARLTKKDNLIDQYIISTLDTVLAHQIKGDKLDGAICQNSFGNRQVLKFFPYYVARCIPALVDGYTITGQKKYLEGAQRALAFIMRWRYNDGSLPQVIYHNGQINRYPQWIAGVGDVLRAIAIMQPYGPIYDETPTLQWMLAGRMDTGGFQTARGFGAQLSQHTYLHQIPAIHDLLPVCGWCDKVFRELTRRVITDAIHAPSTTEMHPVRIKSLLQGKQVYYCEDRSNIVICTDREVIYRWNKDQSWAEVANTQRWWK